MDPDVYWEQLGLRKYFKICGFSFLVFSILFSCNNSDLPINRNVEISYNDSIKKLNDFISNFCLEEFNESRKQIVEEGKEHGYKVSEIRKVGKVLKYEIVIPTIEGKTEYFLDPQKNEFQIIVVGDKDIAKMYYQQSKISKKWSVCNNSGNDEQCETTEDWKSRPIQSHFVISLVNHENISIYTFRRVISLK